MNLPTTMTWGPFRRQPIAAMTEAYLKSIVWNEPGLPDGHRGGVVSAVGAAGRV